MSDPLIRELSNYVILEPNKNQRFLSSEETLKWLCNWLKAMEELPKDLQEKNSIKEASKHLLDTACNLEIKPGLTIQWFAVRLESPHY